jgi:ankyrin repeat protein
MSLLTALISGDAVAAQAQLDAGADANELGEGGTTPLMVAAERGDAAWVKRLLGAGAEPSLVDGMGETALLKAAAGGHTQAYQALVTLASDDEREAAAAYLSAAGKTQGPPSEPASSLRTRLVGATARAAKFFGDENPAARLERVKRAEKHRKR